MPSRSTLPSWANKTGGGGGPGPRKVGNSTLPSWAATGGPTPTKKPAGPKPKSGGGLLHTLGKALSQTGTDLYNTAVHSPSGLYQFDKAAISAQLGNPKPLLKLGVASGESTVQDFKHPLRHPGNTLLDTLAVASVGAGTAARVAAVGRAIDEGATVGEVARAAIKGPGPITRSVAYNGERVPAGFYSRSALKRPAQRLYDKFQQRFPDVKLPIRNLHERVGHELKRNRRIEEAVAKVPAERLGKVRLNAGKQTALQVAAEGVPVTDRIAFHQRQLAELEKAGKTKLAAATRRKIRLLEQSRKYLDGSGAAIADSQPTLRAIFKQAHTVARQRERILGDTSQIFRANGKTERVPGLSDSTAAGRLTKPAEVITGERFDPQLVPELFRFPYKAVQPKGALFKAAGYKGGVPVTPGTVSHEFTGGLLKSGAFRSDTTKLVAESYLEAHRFAALMRHRDEFLRLAHDSKQSSFDIPIRADRLKNKPWPKVIQDIAEKPALSENDTQALGNYFENVRGHIFPNEAQLAEENLLGPGAHPDVKWIDRRVLGGLDQPNPSVSGSTRSFLRPFDSINNASRAAILYLKPAYAVPNMLGNAALNLVQQGWAAPFQIARSAKVWHGLSDEERATVKAAMGEGVSGALHTEQGPLSKSVNFMANLWQRPVDTPFRVNAFLYEARRAGFKTPAQVRGLLKDRVKLTRVAREASSAAIDYGNLGPFEQSVIRRVIFFYPWVKGSTRYAGRFLTDHPVQAAALGQAGRQGATTDAKLGPLPSYMDGVFQAGHRGYNPLVVNPNSAGVLQTPAQLLETIRSLGEKNPGSAFTFAQNLTPATAALLALLSEGLQRNQSPIGAAKQQLVGGLPLVSLIQGLQHPPVDSAKPRVYPRTARDVWLHFLLGGLAPTPVNIAKAHQSAYMEKHPR